MKSDDLCAANSNEKLGLVLRLLGSDASDQTPTLLIQGSADALHFLADLIKSVADEAENDGFSISPKGAGSTLFSEKATHGIYIHCTDHPGETYRED